MSANPRELPPALCLMGPTASGKTRLAVELSQRYPFDIISVDSAQVYRGLDIGTGKPDKATLELAPHRLIDIREPSEAYSAAEFRNDALAAMENAHEGGRIPLLVGGTMLYFKVLRDGLASMPPADESIRGEISALAEREGWEAVHRRLAEVDPASAKRIHPNDPQRLQRALEIYEISGKPMSDFHDDGDNGRDVQPPFKLNFIAMVPSDRTALHRHIEARFHRMLSSGFVEEVKNLRARDELNPALPALRAVGYRQIWDYLNGIYDYDTMIEKAVAATRQLAKRQLTWLRNWPDLAAIDSEKPQEIADRLKSLGFTPN